MPDDLTRLRVALDRALTAAERGGLPPAASRATADHALAAIAELAALRAAPGAKSARRALSLWQAHARLLTGRPHTEAVAILAEREGVSRGQVRRLLRQAGQLLARGVAQRSSEQQGAPLMTRKVIPIKNATAPPPLRYNGKPNVPREVESRPVGSDALAAGTTAGNHELPEDVTGAGFAQLHSGVPTK
jgi:hypothetical protein